MQYCRVGEYVSLSRITGPRHNILQLRLTGGPACGPIVERLPPTGKCTHEPLDEAAIVANVMQGIDEANKQFGTRLVATHLRYVANDTRPESVYRLLALKLVAHFLDDRDAKGT